LIDLLGTNVNKKEENFTLNNTKNKLPSILKSEHFFCNKFICVSIFSHYSFLLYFLKSPHGSQLFNLLHVVSFLPAEEKFRLLCAWHNKINLHGFTLLF
jgi:hypothetical protein